jgi:hypothetical protein
MEDINVMIDPFDKSIESKSVSTPTPQSNEILLPQSFIYTWESLNKLQFIKFLKLLENISFQLSIDPYKNQLYLSLLNFTNSTINNNVEDTIINLNLSYSNNCDIEISTNNIFNSATLLLKKKILIKQLLIDINQFKNDNIFHLLLIKPPEMSFCLLYYKINDFVSLKRFEEAIPKFIYAFQGNNKIMNTLCKKEFKNVIHHFNNIIDKIQFFNDIDNETILKDKLYNNNNILNVNIRIPIIMKSLKTDGYKSIYTMLNWIQFFSFGIYLSMSFILIITILTIYLSIFVSHERYIKII